MASAVVGQYRGELASPHLHPRKMSLRCWMLVVCVVWSLPKAVLYEEVIVLTKACNLF